MEKGSKARKLNEAKLKRLVKTIVNEHSGGIKFTELIVAIISASPIEKIDLFNLEINLEKIIRSMDNVKILEYTWEGMNRAKMFVYTP